MFFRTLHNRESNLEVLKTAGVVEILPDRKGQTPVTVNQVDNVVWHSEKHILECFYGSEFEIGDAVFVRGRSTKRFTCPD